MNKKALILALSLAMLTGCGNKTDETKSTESNNASITSTEKETKKDENKSNEKEESKAQEEVKTDNDSFANPKNIGKTISNEQLDYEIKKAGLTENEFSTGPFKIKITGVSAGTMTPKTEEMKSYLEDKDNTQAIILYASVENTEDSKANLYLNQSQITTDTQEQLEPDLFLSEGNGEFLGSVKQDMSMVYYPQTDVEEIKEVVMYVNAPLNENFESIGDELTITIKFDDKGNVESIN